jgi:hypothetical protein
MPSGPASQGHFLVAATPDSFYIRVVGLATMLNSVGLQETLEDLLGRGIKKFLFDLESCTGFDSTFMGILLGIALPRDGERGNGNGHGHGNGNGNGNGNGSGAVPTVIVLNSSAAHVKLLSGVGIDRVVRLHPGTVKVPPLELKKLEDSPVEPVRRIRSMVTAHDSLVRLGGANVEQFGAMLDALKRELGM